MLKSSTHPQTPSALCNIEKPRRKIFRSSKDLVCFLPRKKPTQNGQLMSLSLTHTPPKGRKQRTYKLSFQSSRQQTGGGQCRGSVQPKICAASQLAMRCCVHVNDCHKNVLPARKPSITASSQSQSRAISSVSAHSVPSQVLL